MATVFRAWDCKGGLGFVAVKVLKKHSKASESRSRSDLGCSGSEGSLLGGGQPKKTHTSWGVFFRVTGWVEKTIT